MEWISFSAPMRILTVSARARPLRRIAGAASAPISACLRDRLNVLLALAPGRVPGTDEMRVFMIVPALFLITAARGSITDRAVIARRVYTIRRRCTIGAKFKEK